ncbi:hypothetical protein [Breznakiella homolactica]|uniref:Uncharacterized protein n=1 Tax=Breznakiella homolactica TaxID=2798577 RepID=A0A7T7XQH3_9SPIR|nr:hypothetical protein [Breznakiella homolactica]QQO10528.1 hypothetical protein JFL75_06330 [Breznakiella homolactica]
MEIIDEIVSEIDTYVDYVSALELIAKELNASIIQSPLQNFNDVMWHYKELYELEKNSDASGDEPTSIVHIYSIEEHLYCGLKDITIAIIDTIKYRIKKFLDADPGSYKKKQGLRTLYQEYKFLEINIKTNEIGQCSLHYMETAIISLKQLYIKTLELCRRLGIERTIIRGL